MTQARVLGTGKLQELYAFLLESCVVVAEVTAPFVVPEEQPLAGDKVCWKYALLAE